MVVTPWRIFSSPLPRNPNIPLASERCRSSKEEAPAGLVEVGFKESEARHIRLFRGRGCERCSNTGYKGRVGLYEVLEVDDELKEMILSGGSAFELRQKAMQGGMMTLRMSGLQKIRDGMTTVEEVVRETVL